MSDPSEIIKKVNREYADLIYAEITNRKLFDNIKSYEDLKNKARGKSNLILPSTFRFDNAFQLQVHRMRDELREFWKDKNDEYMQALNALDTLKIYSIGGWVEDLALYFDTVIFSHATPSFFYPSSDSVRSTIALWESIAPVYQFIPLLKADTDFPIIAFNPNYDSSSKFEAKLLDVKYGRIQEIDKVIAKRNGIDALNKLSKIDFDIKSPSDMQKYIRSDGKVDLSELFHVEDFMKYLDERKYILEKKINKNLAQEMLDSVHLKKKIVSGEAFMHLMILFFVEFEILEELDEQSTRLKAYPHIHQPDLYKLKMEIESGYAKEYLDFDDKMFAAHSLSLPPLITLGQLTPEKIVRFRESGGMDELRSTFANECKQIRYAPIAEFPSIANNVVKTLKQKVEDNNNQIRASQVGLRNTLGIDTLNLCLSLGIAFLTINFPPVAASVFLTPAALVSFGTVLASEGTQMIDDLVTGKKKTKELNSRPIGIIAENIERLDNEKLAV